MTEPIITNNILPPIPDRSHDWCAYREGTEENGLYGWGRTEEQAIADLLEIEECHDNWTKEPPP